MVVLRQGSKQKYALYADETSGQSVAEETKYHEANCRLMVVADKATQLGPINQLEEEQRGVDRRNVDYCESLRVLEHSCHHHTVYSTESPASPLPQVCFLHVGPDGRGSQRAPPGTVTRAADLRPAPQEAQLPSSGRSKSCAWWRQWMS